MDASEQERLERENRELRRELERHKGLLNAALQATPAFVAQCDREYMVESVNRLQEGYRLEDVVGTSLLAFIPPDSQDAAKAAFEESLTGEFTQFPSASVADDGKRSLYETYVAPVFEGGQVTGLCVAAVDVTADRERGEALRVVDDKLRVAVEATGIGLWTWDAKHGVVWDTRMREITGHDTPLAHADWVELLVHPEDREDVAKAMELTQQGVFASAPHRIVRPDGEVRWILPAGRVVADANGVPLSMSGGMLDITKLRELEEQMVQVQKLEAVGSLTAGVAHNFNNLLMAILPTLELLEPVVPLSHRQHLEDAMHAAERGAELVRELMTFAGQRGRASRVLSHPSQIVDHALKICRRTFDGQVALGVRYDNELPALLCDPGAIEHVLVNLLLNARDALGSGGGRIQLIVRRAAPEEAEKVQGPHAVCIEVQDNGEGIQAAFRPKIFEPFVSSKGPNGTGLGLSTAYAVVTEHGGSIEVDSVVGEGTTFRIFLPADGVAVARSAAPAPEGKHVLVVDDEAPVRRVVRKMLERSHFFVSEASSVEEASRALIETTPDLVLLDRSLPGQNGRELVAVARQRCPGAKILYFTGQHIPPDERREVDGVLQKPVRSKALVEAIESILREE